MKICHNCHINSLVMAVCVSKVTERPFSSVCQIWMNSLKDFLRCYVHEKGTEKVNQKNIMPPAMEVRSHLKYYNQEKQKAI